MSEFKESGVYIEKIEGGFIVQANSEGKDVMPRKILRKLSEVIAFVKEQLADTVPE